MSGQVLEYFAWEMQGPDWHHSRVLLPGLKDTASQAHASSWGQASRKDTALIGGTSAAQLVGSKPWGSVVGVKLSLFHTFLLGRTPLWVFALRELVQEHVGCTSRAGSVWLSESGALARLYGTAGGLHLVGRGLALRD